jgi:hypothetical protein
MKRQLASVVLGVSFLGLTCLPALCTPGGDTGDPYRHVRTWNARIAEILGDAYNRSAAFRAVLDAIEASDSIVYLEEGRCHRDAVRSCLLFVAARDGVRYLRIYVDPRQPKPEVIRQLAHELHHATEVAVRPEVVDAPTFRALYREIGFEACPRIGAECWETTAARELEWLVVREMERSRSFGSSVNGKP